MIEVIKTENLSKHFGKVPAVDNLSLNIRKGEIYGFLGLNGAGKTTTIRMLLGMISPTKGVSLICGKKVTPGSTDIWQNIGYLVEVPYSYPDLTVRENLEIARRLRFISDKKSVEQIIEKLQLTPYANRKAKNLSQGNAQRLGLAKALIHKPEILILDEPSNSLDPSGIVEIRELLLDMVTNHGVTVFISSHILGEISKIATRIGIIHNGRLIQEVDANQLDNYRKKKLLVSAMDKEKLVSAFNRHNLSLTHTENGTYESESEFAINQPGEIAKLLVNDNVLPTLLKVDVEDLESYFLRIISMEGDRL
jgi:ABC-2 type transport system ATP-binding protein